MSLAIAIPDRSEIMKWLVDLRDGTVTPERAAEWAAQWLLLDDVPGQHLEVADYGAWDALSALGGADMSGWPDRTLLYGRADFSKWVDDLKTASTAR
ncbi:hypothetical protein [Caulobacter segnis]